MCNGLVGSVGEWKVAADRASTSEVATGILFLLVLITSS